MVNQAMLKKLQKIQREMEQTQRELEETIFTGSAAGMVTVSVTGDKHFQDIKINPECVDPEDVDMLQDTIIAAINDAMVKIEKTTEEKMGKYAAMMPNMPF